MDLDLFRMNISHQNIFFKIKKPITKQSKVPNHVFLLTILLMLLHKTII